MEKILTIVIPTYNRSKDLVRCINSIPKDQQDKISLLIIDDCSTDETSAELSRLKGEHSNIDYVIFSKNQGVSSARNFGLKNLKTKYVTFIDSDDEFNSAFLKGLIEQIEIIEFDLLITGFVVSPPVGSIETFGIFNEANSLNLVNTRKLIKDYLKNPRGNSVLTYVWAKVYSSDFLIKNNIFFREDLQIFEDIEFLSNILMLHPRVFAIGVPIYTYHINNSGLSVHSSPNLNVVFEILDKYGHNIEQVKLSKSAQSIWFIRILVSYAKRYQYMDIYFMLQNHKNLVDEIDLKEINSRRLKFLFYLGVFRSKIIASLLLCFLFQF